MKKLPWVTLTILIICLVVANFSLANNDIAMDWGVIPGIYFSGKEFLKRLFCSMFVHVAYLHLLGNMVFLAAVGPAVEQAAGWWRFIIVFLVGGIAGIFLHLMIVRAAMPNDLMLPLIGASSPTAALIGYFWLRYSKQKVPIFPRVSIAAYWLVFVWLVLQVIGGVMATQQFGAPVAYWAHVGGFVAGFLLAFIFKAGEKASQEYWEKSFESAKLKGPEAQIGVAKKFLENSPNDLEALRVCAEGFEKTGNVAQAKRLFVQMMEIDPTWQQALAARKLFDYGELLKLPIPKRLKIAQSIFKTNSVVAEKLLESVIEDTHETEAADALGLLIDLLYESDVAAAQHYARRLSEDFPFSIQYETAKRRHKDLF